MNPQISPLARQDLRAVWPASRHLLRCGCALALSALVACALALSALAACAQTVTQTEVRPATSMAPEASVLPAFKLKPEVAQPLQKRERIDVNLGQTPAAFVRAAYGQLNGRAPVEATVREWADKLRADPRLRRIDVVRALAKAAGRADVPLDYSDPWQAQIELEAPPPKTVKRDLGAVMMYFFNTPDGVNGKMDWANTHTPGMDKPAPILGWGDKAAGYYDPKSNPGFWYRELSDAKYAGLDFVLLNTYGPDLSDGSFDNLLPALNELRDPIKIGLFDDTWAWGEPWFSDFWKTKPDLSRTEAAARTLYDAKWKPFFARVPAKNWYRFRGHPLIYFYNAGKLEPRNQSAAVLKRMKAMFQTDFGVEPFVVVDAAYFEDPNMAQVADSKDVWFTLGLPDKRSHVEMNGVALDHAMVKWDPYGRDARAPGADELLVKGPELLKRVLNESRDADLLILATWNDIGEGTGINRNIDYYYQGHWLEPDYFMKLTRASQQGKILE